MAKQKSKTDTAAAEQVQGAVGVPKPAEISFEDAAHLVDIAAELVFAVNEYADRFHVITTDGQRLVAMK